MSIVLASNPQEEMKAFIQMFEFRKGVSTPCPPPHPFLKSSPPFVKIAHPPHPPTLLANRSSQVFLINRNETVKLSSINTINLKQHNFGFFIFKFTL